MCVIKFDMKRLALGFLPLLGCATSNINIHNVPNLEPVSDGLWRSGQPSPDSWSYLYSLGIRRVIKLNYESEASDAPALKAGMQVLYFPIPPKNDLRSIFTRPDPNTINTIINIMSEGGGTLVHCTHGQDRTGLVVGVYRVQHDKVSKDIAWKEMIAKGFHPQLPGLLSFWIDYK